MLFRENFWKISKFYKFLKLDFGDLLLIFSYKCLEVQQWSKVRGIFLFGAKGRFFFIQKFPPCLSTTAPVLTNILAN